MTSISGGGAFYRVQNELTQNSDRLSQSMQRLASGKQNISPGDRSATTAVAFQMKAESASLKVGIMNGTEALQSIEMVTNDLAQMNDIVVRLEEIHALGSNGYNTTADTTALEAEANNLLAEMQRIAGDAKWKGNDIIKSSSTDTTQNTMSFGRNAVAIDIVLDPFEIPEVALGFNTLGDDVFGDIDVSTGANAIGTSYTKDSNNNFVSPARQIAGRSLMDTLGQVDTKLHDKAAQSILEVDGAVYFEHLTAAAQANLTTTVAADVDALTVTKAAAATTDDDLYTVAATVAPNNLSVMTNTLDNQANTEPNNQFGRKVIINTSADQTVAGAIGMFKVSGVDMNDNVLVETLAGGTAAGNVTTTNFFKSVDSIQLIGGASSTIKAGSAADIAVVLDGVMSKGGTSVLGAGRNVTLTSGGDDSTLKFTIKGVGLTGLEITETINGGNDATVTTTAFFKSVTSITGAKATAGTLSVGAGTVLAAGPRELAGSDIGSGSAEAAIALADLKTVVDNLNINAGTLYNKVSNVLSHMGSLNAGYQLDVSSKLDVDFAGETAELAKGQILAQAGTAMLAQANAQQQGMLALLQS
jgi:flagellin-like hook-associated protein FlgL